MFDKIKLIWMIFFFLVPLSLEQTMSLPAVIIFDIFYPHSLLMLEVLPQCSD